jgi:hypothetical protein
MMQRERDALIAAEEDLKSKCSALEKKLAAERRHAHRTQSNEVGVEKHVEADDEAPLTNGRLTDDSSLDHDDNDDDGSLTSLNETEYDVYANNQALAMSQQKNSNSNTNNTYHVDSKTMTKKNDKTSIGAGQQTNGKQHKLWSRTRSVSDFRQPRNLCSNDDSRSSSEKGV